MAKKTKHPRRKKRSKTGKIILFSVEIIVLALMVMFLYSALRVEKSGKVVIPEEAIVINEEVKEYAEEELKGYRNIALFGVDSTSGQLAKNTRSDAIMVASVNLDTYEVRLVSVFRDTYLNLGNDSYNKCNVAYARGGPEQAINMLNMNLDLNITDFVTVGFKGLADTIDALGGVMIDIDEVELQHINNYQSTMASDMKRSFKPVESTGYQLVDGLAATAYCRIRYTAGDDFKRTERQREVLTATLEKAQNASLSTLTKIAGDIFPSIYTNFDLADIVDMLADAGKYKVVADAGFPEASMRTTGMIGKSGSCVVPLDLKSNAIWLHEFLFESENYTPSADLIIYSDKIHDDTAPYLR